MTDTNGKTGLHAALIRARAAIGAIPKTAVNPHFKNKYAPLGEILSHVLPPLAANDLALSSRISPTTSDGLVLVVELSHALTGEVVSSYVPLIGATDMQKLGGAVSYAQRYGIGALLSLELEDDDDGNRAAGVGARKPQAVKPSPAAPAATDPNAKISEDRARKLVAFRQTLGVGLMQSPHATIRAEDLTNAQADEIGHWHVDRVKAARAFSAPPAPHDEPEEVQGETASAGGAGDELVFPDAPPAPAYHATPGTLTPEEQDKLAAAKKRRAEADARRAAR